MQFAMVRSGTGKTFWLEALGQLAVEVGLKVAWFSLEDLGVLVRRPWPVEALRLAPDIRAG
jgi:hypothetical protein